MIRLFFLQCLTNRISPPDVFLLKGVLKICSKFTGEHPCRSVFSIKLQSNFIENTLRHGCSPVNLLHIFRTPFPNNTSEGLLLDKNKSQRNLNDDLFIISEWAFQWKCNSIQIPVNKLIKFIFLEIIIQMIIFLLTCPAV